MNQDEREEMKEALSDMLKGIAVALIGLAIVIAVFALTETKREQREAEREADAAHAARVFLEDGRSSCK